MGIHTEIPSETMREVNIFLLACSINSCFIAVYYSLSEKNSIIYDFSFSKNKRRQKNSTNVRKYKFLKFSKNIIHQNLNVFM